MSDQTEANKDRPVESKGRRFKSDRRRFLAYTGMYTAGLMGSALLGACRDSEVFAEPDSGPSDAAILQFALNLEYLEAEFYLRAATGMGLPRDLAGTGKDNVTPPPTRRVTFNSNEVRNYAHEIAADERDHVAFLRKALSGAGVPVPNRPTLDLKNAFRTAAAAASLPNASSFDPFANESNFLLAAYIFEDVGVTAYKGAAPLVDNKTYLSAAAGILAAEAYHAGLVRTALYGKGMGVRTITNAISDARDSLDGARDLDQGTQNRNVTLRGQSYTAANIASLDDHGKGFGRTPGQVLNIVYLNPGSVRSGGFFPAGITVPGSKKLTQSA